MPSYRFIRCGKCRAFLEFAGSPYDVIGEPLVICHKCQSVVQLSSKGEWDMKKWSDKAAFFIMMGLMALVYGFGLGLLTALGLAYVFHLKNEPFVWWFSPFGIFAYLGYLIWNFRKEVAASRQRMLDPKYRDILRQYGILK